MSWIRHREDIRESPVQDRGSPDHSLAIAVVTVGGSP